MENVNLLEGETTEELISETFDFKIGNIVHKLNIESNKENIKFQIFEENLLNQLYENEFDLERIKTLYNKFSKFTSCQELFNYIKAQIKDNYIEINKISINKISIRLKQENIEINLFKIKANPELIMRNLCEEILNLKKRCKKIENNAQYATKEKNIINNELQSLKKEKENILNDIKNLKEEKVKYKKIKEKYKNIETMLQKYQNLDETINNIIEDKIKEINEKMENIITENKELKKENKKISKKSNELEELIYKLKIINNKFDNTKNDSKLKKGSGSEEIKLKKNSSIKNINFSNKNNILIDFKKHPADNNNNDIMKENENKKAYKKKVINQYINKQNINENFFTERNEDYYFNQNLNNIDAFSYTYNRNKNNANRFMTPKTNNRDFSKDNYQNFEKKLIIKNILLNNNKDFNFTLNYKINSENIKINTNKSNNFKLGNNQLNIKKNLFNNKKLNEKNPEKEIFNYSKKENHTKNYSDVINYKNELIKSKSFSSLNKNKDLDINKNEFREKNDDNNNNIKAIIQCLLNIKELTDYFLKEKEKIKSQKNKNKLSNSLLDLIENLNKNKTIKEYFLNIFENSLYIIKPPIENNFQSNNSRDLLELIIKQLHNELNQSNQDFNDFSSKNIENFQEYKNIFQKYYKSIISQLFYFRYNIQIKCRKCNAFSNNIQLSYLLVFPLEEVKEFKNNIYNISIYDCFKYYQRPNYVEKICDICNSKENFMEKKNILLDGPKILILNITKSKSKETNIKFNLEEKINISEFVHNKEKKQYNYELIGIMTSSENDHYISFCKSYTNNKWYKYDKSSVTQCSFKDLKIKGNSDILFYSLLEN